MSNERSIILRDATDARPLLIGRNGTRRLGLLRVSLRAILLSLVMTLAHRATLSQTVDSVNLVESCRSCRIELTRVVRFGGVNDPGSVGGTAGVVQAADGSWILTHQYEPHAIVVYGSTGQFIRRVGRRGQGPGEFLSAGKIVQLPDRRLWVVDTRNDRVSEFSPALSFLRAFRLPISSISQTAFVNDTTYLINGEYRTPAAAGYPLHLISTEGYVLSSFGSESPVVRSDRPDEDGRTMANVRQGSVWIAHLARYRLEHWTLNGILQRVLDRNVDWFRPHGSIRPNGHAAPPPPFTGALQESPDGLVWIAIRVPDPRWRSAFTSRQGPQGMTGRRIDSLVRYQDTILEVLDPRSGAVLATTRVDHRIHEFAGPNQLVMYIEDENGSPYIEIWNARLVR